MTSRPEPIKILAPAQFRDVLSRRRLMQLGAGSVGLAALLSACGSDDESGGDTTAASAGDTAGTSAPSTAAGGSAASTPAPADGEYSEVVTEAGGTLAMYTWGDYNDPEIVGAQAEEALGVQMKVDFYSSNEDLITKLSTANGTSGFDIVVPTGPYLPQMIEKGLLQKFDMTKMPNFVNLDANYLGQRLGSEQRVQRVQGLGLDRMDLRHDADQHRDRHAGRTSSTSVRVRPAATARSSTPHPMPIGMYCWANGIDWNTEDDGRSRRLREVPRRRVRCQHQGVRQLPVDQDRRGCVFGRNGLQRRRTPDIRPPR